MSFTTYPTYPTEVRDFRPTIHDWDAWVKDPVRYPVDKRYTKNTDGLYVPTLPPTRPNKSIWKDGVAHYTGADNLIDGDPGESYDRLDDYLNAIHVSYVNSRGYSIGYNWGVDYLGGIWKLRGWDVQNAANAGYNEFSFSILCLVDGADPLNDLMLRSVRWLMMMGEVVSGKMLGQRGHQEVGKTACPGVGIMTQLNRGILSPRYYSGSTPADKPGTTPPTNKEGEMPKLIQIEDNGMTLDPAYFLVTGTYVEWCTTQGRADSLSFIEQLDHAGPSTVPAIPYRVDRGFMQYFTLIGANPTYAPDYTGPKTTPADFARWVM